MKQLVKLSVAIALAFTFNSCEKNIDNDLLEKPKFHKTGDDERENDPILVGVIAHELTLDVLSKGLVVLKYYDDIVVDSTNTDSLGVFHFDILDQGDYYLDIYNDQGLKLGTSDMITIIEDSTYIQILY